MTPEQQRIAIAEACPTVPIRDLLAVLEPVIDWHQIDDLDPLDILRDIVSALQQAVDMLNRQRAVALAGPADKRRLDWMDAHPLKTQVLGGASDGHDGKAWAIAAHGGNLREAIDAWILSPDPDAWQLSPAESSQPLD